MSPGEGWDKRDRRFLMPHVRAHTCGVRRSVGVPSGEHTSSLVRCSCSDREAAGTAHRFAMVGKSGRPLWSMGTTRRQCLTLLFVSGPMRSLACRVAIKDFQATCAFVAGVKATPHAVACLD